MEAVTISLTQVNQVQQFVNVMSKVPYDVDMVSGRYTINAKSLLGIYSLDLNRPLHVFVKKKVKQKGLKKVSTLSTYKQ